MNVPPGVGEAFVRALALGLALAWVAPGVLRAASRHRWLWLLVLAPLVTPPVVVAFAYVGWSPGSPATLARELAYALLLGAKLLPLAVILELILPPPPLTASARHCLTLARRSGGVFYGPWRNRTIVAGLTTVFAFQEFELASVFFGVRSWTVSLFDAQAGGLPLADTLELAALPLLLEFVVLASVVVLFVRTRVAEPRETSPALDVPRMAFLWPLAAAAVFTVWPAVLLLRNLPAVSDQLQFLGKVWNSGVLALGSATCAGTLACLAPVWVLVVLAVPGLVGSLVVALWTVALFQLPFLSVVYDSPIPVLLAGTLLLMPLATCFRLALDRIGAPRGLHLARLLERSGDPAQSKAGRGLWFAQRGAHLGLAMACLFLLGFFEVVATDLLRPSGMSPAAPTLYNMIHYGRSPGLAAMVLLMVASALGAAGVGFAGWAIGRRHLSFGGNRGIGG